MIRCELSGPIQSKVSPELWAWIVNDYAARVAPLRYVSVMGIKSPMPPVEAIFGFWGSWDSVVSDPETLAFHERCVVAEAAPSGRTLDGVEHRGGGA